MKRLERVILVQFSLFDFEEFEFDQNSALLGANGAGKTTILDAIQVAMLGAHGNYTAFNTQKAGGTRDRTLRDYCLGTTREGGEQGVLVRKRDDALSFISLVFRDTETGLPLTIGVNIGASAKESEHETLGRYVLPGVALTLDGHLEPGSDREGGLPLRWSDFQAAARKLCDKAGTVALFPPLPEKYIDEMLHALSSRHRSINKRDFVNAFRKSLTLRGIDSVNDFVRNFVVPPVSLNRERATAQIREFNRLQQIVERVRLQISELKLIDGQYEKVNKEERRIATLGALGISYQREHFGAQLETHQATLNREMAAYVEHEDKVKSLRLSIADAEKATERVLSALFNAPGAASYSHAEERLRDFTRSVKEATDYLGSEVSKVARAIHELYRLRALPNEQAVLYPLDQQLAQAEKALADGDVTGLGALLERAMPVLERCKATLATTLKKAQGDEERAREGARAAVSRAQQAQKGGAPLSSGPALVIDILRRAGIDATPVCDLVKVNAPEWQRAIEGFLGRNRESLVVKAGREREAVRVLRKQPEHSNVHGVTIVQPSHLPHDEWSDPDGKLVGSLLTGDSVAVGYVRFLLGRGMRRVQTEEELEKHPRSLTRDGMLSANAGTRRLRLPAVDELLLGRRSSDEDVRRLVREAEDSSQRHHDAMTLVNLLETAQDRIAKAAGVEMTRVSYQITRIAQGALDIEGQQRHMEVLDSKDLAPLREEVARCRAAAEALRKEESEATQAFSAAQTLITEAERQIALLKPLHESGLAEEAQAKASPDYDPEIEVALRARIDAVPSGPEGKQQALPDRVRDCERRALRARDEREKLRVEAMRLLTEYLAKHNVVLGDERSDWKKAWSWARETLQMLEESELKDYAAKAEEARKAADFAFRTDISVRMRKGIGQMQDTLAQLNRQLKACPPFSNGERYRFEAKPAEAHRSIYDYIMRSDADDLLGEAAVAANDEAHQRILQLLDLSASGSKAENPIDDFRLLFSFDVLIEQQGVVVTKLSKRLGTGSGGEYKSPFYVIAGAALAAAYRLDHAAPGSGMALMLLDEAFDGMDYQNTVATTRFLNCGFLGLQLVMAAPDTDLAKLTRWWTRCTN